MKIYELKCEILTPLHIGDGSELQPYEYIITDKFYKIPLEDFILDLPVEKQKVITDLMEQDIVKLRQFLKDNLDPLRFGEYFVEVSNKLKSSYNTKIADELNQLLISPFIRTSNRPYIPGSSLKGAIRTAVVAYFAGKNIQERNARNLEARVLGYGFFNQRRQKFQINLQNDPFRAIKITDSFLPENSTLIEEATTITKQGEIKVFREVTYSKLTNHSLEFTTELRIDDNLINKNPKIRKKLNIETLTNACNEFYNIVIQHEKDKYFRNNPMVKGIYNQLSSQLKQDKSFILRLGWGSGKNSVTLNLKKDRPQYVKTRRLINKIYPLGWIKAKWKEKIG